jgi:hypothetical protein
MKMTIRKVMRRQGYIISTGDGHPVETKTVDEVKEAVSHYFDGRCNVRICPLCNYIKRNRKP